eukprot:SAG31_NODE_2043_length_6582_cov_2.798952_1_plen_93_part_00
MPSTRARPDLQGAGSPAPKLGPSPPRIVSVVEVQERSEQAQGVDPALLAAVRAARATVSSSVQTKNSLLSGDHPAWAGHFEIGGPRGGRAVA